MGRLESFARRVGTDAVASYEANLGTQHRPWDRPGTVVCAGIDKIVPAAPHKRRLIMSEERNEFSYWAIVELMGHRKLAGHVAEVSVAGAGMLRLDVPGDDGRTLATQFYSPSAVYCITPTTEEIARALAKRYQPSPAERWELPQLPAADRDAEIVDGDDSDGENKNSEDESWR